MTTLTLTLPTLGARRLDGGVADAGCVDYDRTASFTSRRDRTIRCTSGHLWVTLENDPNDIVLMAGDRLYLAAPGKVVIGGRGAYRLDAEGPRAMAS